MIFLQSKGLSRVFSNTTVQKHQFFGAQLLVQVAVKFFTVFQSLWPSFFFCKHPKHLKEFLPFLFCLLEMLFPVSLHTEILLSFVLHSKCQLLNDVFFYHSINIYSLSQFSKSFTFYMFSICLLSFLSVESKFHEGKDYMTCT